MVLPRCTGIPNGPDGVNPRLIPQAPFNPITPSSPNSNLTKHGHTDCITPLCTGRLPGQTDGAITVYVKKFLWGHNDVLLAQDGLPTGLVFGCKRQSGSVVQKHGVHIYQSIPLNLSGNRICLVFIAYAQKPHFNAHADISSDARGLGLGVCLHLLYSKPCVKRPL